jgi:hypothetical protein
MLSQAYLPFALLIQMDASLDRVLRTIWLMKNHHLFFHPSW